MADWSRDLPPAHLPPGTTCKARAGLRAELIGRVWVWSEFLADSSGETRHYMYRNNNNTVLGSVQIVVTVTVTVTVQPVHQCTGRQRIPRTGLSAQLTPITVCAWVDTVPWSSPVSSTEPVEQLVSTDTDCRCTLHYGGRHHAGGRCGCRCRRRCSRCMCR